MEERCKCPWPNGGPWPLEDGHSWIDKGFYQPGFAAVDLKATIALRELVTGGSATPAAINRLIEAKGNPCWPGKAFDGESAISYAVMNEDLELIRVMHANWPDIDPVISCTDCACGYRHRLLTLALRENLIASAKCLMELGFTYKHLQEDFELNATPRPNFRYSRQHRVLIDVEHQLWSVLYSSFIEREDACRRAVIALMSKRVRWHTGVPPDVMRLISRDVWKTKLRDVWEPQGLSTRRLDLQARRKKARSVFEEESVEDDMQ